MSICLAEIFVVNSAAAVLEHEPEGFLPFFL